MLGKRLGVVLTAAIAVGLIGLATWMMPTSRSHAQDAPYPPAPLPDAGAGAPQGADAPGQEVLTNGPVHEAYAEPTALNPEPPMVVPKQPPAAVEEMPPDVKPDGQNVAWIPGYWAWDDGRRDFIWVSGIWRDTPPNHAWVAGYWAGANGGFQWTPGIWAPSNVEQVNYVPQPPPTLENGPNVPAPTPNDFWVPGTYEYVNANWGWRPGYWTAAQPDWIWIAAHYVWTPSGYLFIPGHWDYELSHRGVLFAPVAFDGTYWAGRPIVYGPRVVIDPGVLTVDFFVRPNYYHYYFGDCYGPAYVGWGFHPWFAVGGVGVGFGYDPLFTYYRWYNVRRDPDWDRRGRERFVYMGAHPEARPPRTYALSVRVGAPGGVHIGITLGDYARRPGPTHFQTVSMEQRRDYAREGVRSQQVARQRAMAETHPGGRPGEGARSLDMHALSQSSGGHLPGAGPAGRPNGAMAGRDVAGREAENRGGAANTGRPGTTSGPSYSTARPGTAGPTTGTPPKTGIVPGPTARPGTVPGRTPPADPKKKPADERGGNGGGGGRFLIQPNGAAAKLATSVPADPQPAVSPLAAPSATVPQSADPLSADSQAGQAFPGFGTFGGLISRNPTARPDASAAADPDAAAANSKDPIKPLTLSPGLPGQLSQFGANGASLTGGQSRDGVSQFSQPFLLRQVGDPAARESASDPIRPLNLLPQRSLPLGNSRQGLPSRPGQPGWRDDRPERSNSAVKLGCAARFLIAGDPHGRLQPRSEFVARWINNAIAGCYSSVLTPHEMLRDRLCRSLILHLVRSRARHADMPRLDSEGNE